MTDDSFGSFKQSVISYKIPFLKSTDVTIMSPYQHETKSYKNAIRPPFSNFDELNLESSAIVGDNVTIPFSFSYLLILSRLSYLLIISDDDILSFLIQSRSRSPLFILS